MIFNFPEVAYSPEVADLRRKAELARAASVFLYGMATGIAFGGAMTMALYGASPTLVGIVSAQGVLWIVVVAVQTRNRLRDFGARR